jgi:hypothetical protein
MRWGECPHEPIVNRFDGVSLHQLTALKLGTPTELP